MPVGCPPAVFPLRQATADTRDASRNPDAQPPYSGHPSKLSSSLTPSPPPSPAAGRPATRPGGIFEQSSAPCSAQRVRSGWSAAPHDRQVDRVDRPWQWRSVACGTESGSCPAGFGCFLATPPGSHGRSPLEVRSWRVAENSFYRKLGRSDGWGRALALPIYAGGGSASRLRPRPADRHLEDADQLVGYCPAVSRPLRSGLGAPVRNPPPATRPRPGPHSPVTPSSRVSASCRSRP